MLEVVESSREIMCSAEKGMLQSCRLKSDYILRGPARAAEVKDESEEGVIPAINSFLVRIAWFETSKGTRNVEPDNDIVELVDSPEKSSGITCHEFSALCRGRSSGIGCHETSNVDLALKDLAVMLYSHFEVESPISDCYNGNRDVQKHGRALHIFRNALRQVLTLTDSDITGSAPSDQPFDTSRAEGGCVLIDLVMNVNGTAVINDLYQMYIDRLISRALIAMSHCHDTQTLLLDHFFINAHAARIDTTAATYSCVYGRGLKVHLRTLR